MMGTEAMGTTKRTLNDLALFGGPPAFVSPMHVGRPNIGDRRRLLERIEVALDRKWLSNQGVLLDEFESRVAEFVGAEHCVAVCNATIGLQLVARALDFAGEVIVPSFTFAGTPHAMSWIGLTPVFCEIDSATHNLDPVMVEQAITPATTAILAVHLWGRACPVDELTEIAQRRGLRLVFDAAHAFGCTYKGRPIGTFGDAEVFSFHATKFVNSAEGGAITTNDGDLARRLRSIRAFGFTGYDTVLELGTNAKMNELSAAMGLTSLDSFDEFIDANRRNYDCYQRAFAGVDGVRLIDYEDGERHNRQYVVLEVTHATDPGRRRDDLIAALHAENVLARRYFFPGCHRMMPYSAGDISLPITEDVADRVLVLPTGISVTDDDIDLISSIITVALNHHAELRRRVGAPSFTG